MGPPPAGSAAGGSSSFGGLRGGTISQVKLMWVVSGSHSETFPMRDIHMQECMDDGELRKSKT